MRGKAIWMHVRKLSMRITPAYAGKSLSAKAYSLVINGSEWGSPPRMRGKGDTHGPEELRFGITPAYAGKRIFRCGHSDNCRDHPRVCGEKGDGHGEQLHNNGSPPRMRGKVGTYDNETGQIRITPAYAGKSRCHTQKSEEQRDHPRVCGEKRILFISKLS